MIIKSVSVLTAPFSGSRWLDRQRISTPMSWFPEHAASRSTWRGPGSDLVWVHITTDDPEVYGIGQSRGGAVTAALIDHHFRELLVGRNGSAVVRRTEELRRAAQPYAGGGIAAMGTSACELALWDLSSRASGLPLTTMLGGAFESLPYYLTVAGPDQLREVDDSIVDGAAVVKVPAPYGVADGRRHLSDNIRVLEQLRGILPDHVGIAVDCFMSWDVPYATSVARLAEPLGLRWIEEPLQPEDFAGYAELRARMGTVGVAGGEHLFTLQQGIRFIEQRCADVLQIDVTWCGGITVAQTLGRLAQEQGMVFAPHASALQPWALHMLGAAGPGAMAEILVGVGGDVAVPAPARGPGVGIQPASVGFR